MSLNNDIRDIKNILSNIQPLYTQVNSRFSKSYLSGSSWYVGDNLLSWWESLNNIRTTNYVKNVNKIKEIVKILILEKKAGNIL